MKKFKDLGFWGKVVYAVVVFILVTTYCNIGYWGGKSYVDARAKIVKGEKPNLFEGFQLSYKSWFASSLRNLDSEIMRDALMFASTIVWPVGLLMSLIVWIAGGIIFGFKFVFLGDFFRLIGKLL